MLKAKIFCITRTCKLFLDTCDMLGVEPYYLHKVQYPNGEFFVEYPEKINGIPIIIFKQLSDDINRDLMELFFSINAGKNLGASKIIVVCPCSPYARQNCLKDNSASNLLMLWRLVSYLGVSDWITIDLHEPVLPYKILRIHNLSANNLLLNAFKEAYHFNENWVCVAADESIVKRALLTARYLNCSFGFCRKIRENGQIRIKDFSGNVKQRSVLLIDDMIDTGSTLKAAIAYLKTKGAEKFVCSVTHGITKEKVLSQIIENSDCLFETNTLPVLELQSSPSLKVVTVAPLLAQAIKSLIV